MNFKNGLFLFACIIILGCKKDNVNTAPYIEFLSITPDSVTQFTDQVTINLRFEDTQGNLGHSNPDSLTMYVKDSRLSQADYFHLPPFTPDTSLNINGQLQINVGSPYLFGNGGVEYVKYNIKVRDYSGLWSNEIITSEISIHP